MGSLIESIIVVLFLFSLCFYGMKVQKDPSADSYLSRELTTNIRGLLALGIVLHHASGYFTEFTFITALRFVMVEFLVYPNRLRNFLLSSIRNQG